MIQSHNIGGCMKKGFTLIELVMVIVIIGILAAVAIPKFVDLTGQAKNGATQGALGALRSGLAIYFANEAATSTDHTGKWPASTAIGTVMSDDVVPVNAVSGNNSIAATTGSTISSTVTVPEGWIYSTDNGKIWAGNNTSW